MNFFRELSIAIGAYFEAHKFIIKNKLLGWVFIPGIFYILFVLSFGYLLFDMSDVVIMNFLRQTGLQKTLDKWSENKWVDYIINFLQFGFKVFAIFFLLSFYKYVYLVIFSPILALLSEKTAEIVEGKVMPFSVMQLIKDIGRAFVITVRNLFWQLLFICILFITTWLLAMLPFIGVLIGFINVIIMLILDAYYFGFSMLDYSCERNKLSASQSFKFVNKHKGLAIGNGAVFLILQLIPFLGWIIAPGYAVVASTLSMYKIPFSK